MIASSVASGVVSYGEPGVDSGAYVIMLREVSGAFRTTRVDEGLLHRLHSGSHCGAEGGSRFIFYR